ncbi:hypothetical protein LINGRAHAP2_LOCUS33219 [Linum grandiflorum]
MQRWMDCQKVILLQKKEMSIWILRRIRLQIKLSRLGSISGNGLVLILFNSELFFVNCLGKIRPYSYHKTLSAILFTFKEM